ncbi:MAG TPA: HD domain-containing phosphohydrolase [Fervidobacterium sp.]|nr:HD domain-containing phosphohydrolase [Fervidobacterium sp.]HQE47778.1 HD domain-containing phosphohydrolase [Fervidobacterium sp.]HUM41373.1 HD domain-containing phosphohydrolase [Fervidobacterium sp.]
MSSSVPELKSKILKRNLVITLIIAAVIAVVFLIWLSFYTSSTSKKEVDILSKSFERLATYVSNILLRNESLIDTYVNSNILIAERILSSAEPQLALEEIEQIYENNLQDPFKDVDLLIVDLSGKIKYATGAYSAPTYDNLHFSPVVQENANEDYYEKFLSFIPNTRRLAAYIMKKHGDEFLVFVLYIDPGMYLDIFSSFAENKTGNVKEIAIYTDAKNRLDTSQKVYDEEIAKGIVEPKIIKKFASVTSYNRYPLYKGNGLSSYVYLKIHLSYGNYFYIFLTAVALFILTMIIFTYLSSDFAMNSFVIDINRLNTAVKEIGHTGILPPQESFELQEMQEFYETLAAILQELSATMQELRATNEELEKVYNEVSKRSEEFRALLINISERLSIIAEGYDEETGHHIYRVKQISSFIGEKLKLDDETIESIEMFSSLHDIGKIFVPKEILLKPGKLTQEEWEIMKQHTVLSKRILDVPGFERALSIALYHHENYDGSGYPFGLKGKEIPIDAQIVKLIDVYDALRSDRPYKKGLTHEESVNIILNGDGRTSPEHFSRELLELFRKYNKEIRRIWEDIK